MSNLNLINTINKNKDNLRNILSTIDTKDIVNLIQDSNFHYHEEGKPLFSDKIYDEIRDFLVEKDPSNQILKQIGSEVIGDNKVKLPFYLGSMDKIKPTQEVLYDKWVNKFKGPYVISSKLDGISILVYFTKDKIKCYTRGNGQIGRDVSHINKIIDFKKISHNIDFKNYNSFAIRGELLISKFNFDKYSDQYENSRNTIAGIINKKNIKDIKINFEDIDFVAFDILYPRTILPSEQFILLKKLGFKIPKYETINKLSIDILKNKLIEYKVESVWEIDGIIVTDNHLYPLNNEGNPKFSFAFKMIDETVETTVLDVLWNKSRDGYLNPRILIEKVKVSGCNIQYVSGKNAKFIKDNQIGPGAKVIIIRSGEVIPEIVKITKKSENIKFPQEYYDNKCQWSPTGVDLILMDTQNDEEVKLQNIIHFFKSIKTKNLSDGTIRKLFNNNYNTIMKILNLKIDQLEKLDGFQEKLSQKIINSISESLHSASIIDFMVGSNLFGRGLGEKKIKLIFDQYPEILSLDDTDISLKEKIIKIDGFSDKLTDLFINNLPNFKNFINVLKMEFKLNIEVPKPKVINSNQIFNDQKIVMTGFRDQEISNFILNRGGKIEDNVTKNTSLLICNNLDSTSNKILKAQVLGIPILSKQQFISKFIAK